MNARAAAIEILARVEKSDAFLNIALDSYLRRHRPGDPRDAALITELCYGTMRRRMALDHAITAQSKKRLSQIEGQVLAALRIGTYQLFYMRLPPHAAVAETIEALKQLGRSRAAGFVNAILRKLSALDALPLPPASEGIEHLAVRESHPQWLVARWVRQFGMERAEEMLAADNQPAPLTIRVNSAKATRDELLSRLRRSGVEASPTAFASGGIILRSPGRVEELEGYAEGLWQVQDEAAQLVGLYAAVPDGTRVLDACAAPGGKALHLAERNRVVASDLSAAKLERLSAEAKRLGLDRQVETLVHDATKPFPKRLGKFDAVVVDAPCSGLGTLRRHPELRYRRKESDIERLAQLQWRILENCQAVVAGGGLLIYAVCSTELEEGLYQAERLASAHPERSEAESRGRNLLIAKPPPPEMVPIPLSDGYLRTFPGPAGLDGFFAARFSRSG
ncbi:MAG TPA: 16S rRNA (cytosine(967)-C(5))-methyltransferase RsmB [Myxococcaceae bacterium]|nr:16S rRNA (cytosine(967)-C(5))-methyltransferase RsmB [Myxococcaceae bacterium]